MFPSLNYLYNTLERSLDTMEQQGYCVEGQHEQLTAITPGYDAYLHFAKALTQLPLRPNWPYREPDDYAGILSEMAPSRERYIKSDVDTDCHRSNIEAGFYGSVLGCILGKPLEVKPSYYQLRRAGQACGQWPIDDFISEPFLAALGRRHFSWQETCRENIRYATADDDLNYAVLGMLCLEQYGANFTLDNVKNNWLAHQCMRFVFGPEQHLTACIAVNRLEEEEFEPPHSDQKYSLWSELLNPMSEECGAVIRMDAYGYAFPGRPDLAVRCAFTDATFTHRKTGVYAAMYIAAILSLLPVADNPIQPFLDALQFIPQKSRFAKACRTCLEYVLSAASFEEAYNAIHARYGRYGHCMIYQEIGTLANTMRFADSIWDGVCKQVMQGNDTDSFGCLAGAMLGIYYGTERLDMRKLLPFRDQIHISLGDFYETSLSKLAKRMAMLPQICQP